jgi:hypothetical protein
MTLAIERMQMTLLNGSRILTLLILGACTSQTPEGETKTIKKENQNSVQAAVGSGIEGATIEGLSDSGISPSALALGEGAPVVDPATMQELGVAELGAAPGGPPVMISANDPVDEAAVGRLSISLPISQGSALTSNTRYIVVFRVKIDGNTYSGIIGSGHFTFLENRIKVKLRGFGIYQVATVMSEYVEETKQKSLRPILDKNEYQNLDRGTFRDFGAIRNAANAIVYSAFLDDFSIDSCSITIDQDKLPPWDFSFDTDGVLSYTFVRPSDLNHEVYGRFFCVSASGADSGNSEWSNYPVVDFANEDQGETETETEPEDATENSETIHWTTEISDTSIRASVNLSLNHIAVNGSETIVYQLKTNEMTCDEASWSTPLTVDANGQISGTPSTLAIGTTCSIVIEASGGGQSIEDSMLLTIKGLIINGDFDSARPVHDPNNGGNDRIFADSDSPNQTTLTGICDSEVGAVRVDGLIAPGLTTHDPFTIPCTSDTYSIGVNYGGQDTSNAGFSVSGNLYGGFSVKVSQGSDSRTTYVYRVSDHIIDLVPQGASMASLKAKLESADNGATRTLIILTSDLDFGGATWMMPANGDWNDSGKKFPGIFDGQGFTIRNLVANFGGAAYVGFFNALDSNAQVSNITFAHFTFSNTAGGIGFITGETADQTILMRGITIKDSTLTSTASYVGGLVGKLHNASILYSKIENSTISGNSVVGGFVGLDETNLGKISRSQFAGTVLGDSSLGGFIGKSKGRVERSISTGTVNDDLTGSSIGGITGEIYGAGAAHEKVACKGCTVKGYHGVGGILGLLGDTLSTSITTCYVHSTTIMASSDTLKGGGGIVGYGNGDESIDHCYSVDLTVTNGSAGTPDKYGPIIGYDDAGEGSTLTDTIWHFDNCTGNCNTDGASVGDKSLMKVLSTFSGWSMRNINDSHNDEIWQLDEGQSYPSLWIEDP